MINLRRRIPAALASIGAAVLAQALAAFWVAKNHGFGRGDLAAYAYWNLLFAIYLYAAATVLQPRLQVARVGVRVFAWILIGGVAGFLWTWIVAVALGPWIMAFSFPVLYIWTAAGALGGAAIGSLSTVAVMPRRGRPWLVLLVPPLTLLSVVVLRIMLLLGGRFVWARAMPEEFTFPEGFVGQVYVIYAAAGHPVLTRDRTRIYHLPASGVLVTKSEPMEGWLDEHFYYRYRDGLLAQIRTTWDETIEDTPENRSDTTIGVYFRTWGQQDGDPGGDPCRVRYTSFFVGRKVDVLEHRLRAGEVDGLQQYVDSCEHARRSDAEKHEAPGTAQ